MNTLSHVPVQSKPRFTALFDIARHYPVPSALLISIADLILLTAVRLGLQTWLPSIPTDFGALFPITLLLVLAVAALRLWPTVGVNGPAHWRNLGLLILPSLMIFVPPLIAGLKPMESSQLTLLLIGYALVGLREELLHRGIILRVLQPLGERRSVLVSAVLFGLMHLSNVMVRGNPAIVAAQAVGAFCFGVGFGALRLRTHTIVPLMVLHMLHDLILQMTNLPLIPLDVAEVTILLFYGLWLVWRRRSSMPGTVLGQ